MTKMVVKVTFRTRGRYESGLNRESDVRSALRKKGYILRHIYGRRSTTKRGKYPKTVRFSVEVHKRKRK